MDSTYAKCVQCNIGIKYPKCSTTNNKNPQLSKIEIKGQYYSMPDIFNQVHISYILWLKRDRNLKVRKKQSHRYPIKSMLHS